MSSPQNIPPWLREQLAKMQQTQQSLQSVMAQKQQVGIERAEIDKALEELEKISENDAVFKHAGSILIKSTKSESTDDLRERKELGSTRVTVLEKQETRLRESLKEQDAKINEMVSGQKGAGSASAPPSNT